MAAVAMVYISFYPKVVRDMENSSLIFRDWILYTEVN